MNKDPKLLQRVQAIAKRLEPQTAVFRKDAPGWKWEVNVIDSNELNAFCMPGGKIMFYSGLINQLHLTDEEIAVVMGHEIAHALREHSREQVSQAIAAQTAMGFGAAAFGLNQNAATLANVGYEALIATHFSRTDEAEADRIGLELTARAGYNPQAGVTLWQKMIKANTGAQPPEFLSSHPADSTRVQQIESLLPVVMPLSGCAPLMQNRYCKCFNPDNPLGREMMVRQVPRQFVGWEKFIAGLWTPSKQQKWPETAASTR